jgi:hypothetical protein
VEPAKSEECPLEFLVHVSALELRHVVVHSKYVVLDSSGRLLGNELTPLEKRNWELFVRAGRQEEPEFGVNVCLDDLVDDAFEFGHEGNAQVAIGQINPITFLGAVLQERSCLFTLALSKRS